MLGNSILNRLDHSTRNKCSTELDIFFTKKLVRFQGARNENSE